MLRLGGEGGFDQAGMTGEGCDHSFISPLQSLLTLDSDHKQPLKGASKEYFVCTY